MPSLRSAALALVVAISSCAAACAPREDLVGAIRSGDVGRVDAFVKRGGAPDTILDHPPAVRGMTPLMLAAQEGENEMTRRLLAAGANPNMTSARGWTALTYACAARKADAVRTLLAAGSDPMQKDPDGMTCQRAAHRISRRHEDEEGVVRALAEVKAPITLSTVIDQLIVNSRLDIAELYLDLWPDEPRVPLLARAIEAKKAAFVSMLLGRGAAPMDTAERAMIERATKKLDEGRARVIAAALAPELVTPEQRRDVFRRAEAARNAEEERREASRAAARKEPVSRPRSSTSSAARSGGSSVADLSATAPLCERPDIRACRERGRSCEQCFRDSLGSVPPPSSGRSTAPPGYVQCGGVLCGKGYVCCLGVTSANRGSETCRLSSRGCSQGWDAERVK